jgi:conjugal transfer pilus assembly protein TraF
MSRVLGSIGVIVLVMVWGTAAVRAAGLGTTACDDQTHKQGQWWKCAPPEPAEEATEPEYAPLPPPPDEEGLLALHPEQVEQLLEDYRENALWQMTPETVGWYYEIADFTRRRAKAFANVTEVVMLGNPDLNMQSQYPTNQPGLQVRNAQRNASIDGRLAAERDNAAIIMLKRESCPYCVPQRAALRHFQAKHGWTVREIDLDQVPSAVARFGTDHTPTTLVIFRGTEEWMPVAIGVESVPRIEESVYRAVRMMRGETTAEQFTLQEYQQGTVLDPTRANRRGQ